MYRINRTLDRLFKSLDALSNVVRNQTAVIEEMRKDVQGRAVAESLDRLRTEVANLKFASTQYYVPPPSVDPPHRLETWHQVVDRTDEPTS